MGYERYYYHKRIGDKLPKDNKIEDPILFTERERNMRDEIFKLKKEMGMKDLGLIFRVSVQITDGALGKLQAKGTTGKTTTGYTGNHIAIFEAELKHPPLLSIMDHDIESYLLASRLKFQNWRLVDIDNFMKGNPPYSEFVTQVDWNKKIDAHQRREQTVVIDSHKEADKMREMMSDYFDLLAKREPVSNAKMPQI